METKTVKYINVNGKLMDLSHPQVMGILNVTPDSFYAGSRQQTEKDIINRTSQIIEEGASIIDIGAYSSRPNAEHISPEEEMRRLRTGLEIINRYHPGCVVSVDTFRADVARMCVEEYGVAIINDIAAGEMDPQMFDMIARLGVPYIIMHMQGTPQNMQMNPHYDNLLKEVFLYFSEKVQKLRDLGVKDIILDPGFGFGKTVEHNYQLMNHLEEFSLFELPLLVGISRKSMIYKLLGGTLKETMTMNEQTRKWQAYGGANANTDWFKEFYNDWVPSQEHSLSIGKGRFGDWLENVQDWGVSRNRYWGTPLNIWECECGCQHAIGSQAELKSMSPNYTDVVKKYAKEMDQEANGEVELHRPFIDDVTITCPKCGKQMHRVPEVIDCWFDSGSMPFAQHHYPFENKETFEKQFPAQFISEAVDQTRGWFYSLLAISTLLFNKAPYENVIVLGLVQDENGQKMSKSKGNAVDPFDALQTYGADAIRWYFYTSSAPWLPSRFAGKTVVEGQRKFMGTLWNTYAFFVLYANIDNFDATKYSLEYDKLAVMDKWLLSRLESTVKAVDDNLANYRIPEAAKALQSFVDDMSNWYVRRSRERFWAKGMEQDKINAYMTLYTALVTVAKAAAPMIPFMTEDIYQNLVKSIDASAPESIHLCDFPEVHENWIDPKMEEDMADLLEIVVMGRAARNTANIKNRQPIGTMYVKSEFQLSEFYKEIIEDELNVKEVVFKDDIADFISYSFKPQMRTVGRF